MKTDSLFYRLFQEFPGIFFELINQSPTQARDYEFTSREVKQLAFRIDGLFLPKDEDADKPFYVVEVQFQPDEKLYYRLCSELFLFLRQYAPPHPWRVVVIYPRRSIERKQDMHFQDMLHLPQVQRLYLDEIETSESSSLGVNLIKLIIPPETNAINQVRGLVSQAQQQIDDESASKNLINLIETIIVYKLPHKSREEIEAMFSLSDLRQTQYFKDVFDEGKQEGKQEGKLESIPGFLKLGMSTQQIAQAMNLPLEVVEEVAKKSN